MKHAMPHPAGRTTPPGVRMAVALALTALAAALAGCSGSENRSGDSDAPASSASEGSSDAPEELYFYALSSVSHTFHLLELHVDPTGQVEGTDTKVYFHEQTGEDEWTVDNEVAGTRSGSAFELERLDDGRILTAVLEDGVLTFTEGTLSNHEAWTQIESVAPLEDMLEVHQELNAGCADNGYLGCEYNNLEWPTELPTGD